MRGPRDERKELLHHPVSDLCLCRRRRAFGLFLRLYSPYIAADKKKQLEQAILDVVPGAVKSRTVKEVGDFKVYEGLDGDGKSLGYAVFAVGPGFSDKIS